MKQLQTALWEISKKYALYLKNTRKACSSRLQIQIRNVWSDSETASCHVAFRSSLMKLIHTVLHLSNRRLVCWLCNAVYTPGNEMRIARTWNEKCY